MSATQNEVNKTKKKAKTYSMSKIKKTNTPAPGLCLRKLPLIFLIYSLVQLVSVFRSCVVILSVFLGDLMSFAKTHPSGSGGLWAHNNVISCSLLSSAVFSEICVCDRGLSERPSANLYCIGSHLIPSPLGDWHTHTHTVPLLPLST